MAILYAQSSHAWSNRAGRWFTATSGGSAQAPATGDTLSSNGFVITVDTDLNIGTGILAGTGASQWQLSAGVTITADINCTAIACATNTGQGLLSSGASNVTITGSVTGSNTAQAIYLSGGSMTINGNLTPGGSNGGKCCVYYAGGDLTVNGNVNSVSSNILSHTINKTSTGTLTIVGNIDVSMNASGGGAAAVYNTAGALNITATNIIGCTSSASWAVYNSSPIAAVIVATNIVSGVTPAITNNRVSASVGVSITANNITTPYWGYAVQNAVAGLVNVTSSSTLSATSYYAIGNLTTGTLNITANVAGSALAAGAYAVQNSSTGVVNIAGSATGGDLAPAVSNASTGTINVTTVIGNGYGPGATTGRTSQCGVVNTAGGTCNVRYLQHGAAGQAPIAGTCNLIPDVLNTFQLPLSTGGTKILVDGLNTAYYPAAANVRKGTAYNAGNTIGTCAMPAAPSVVFGAPVDHTLGTAILTPAALWATDPATMTTGIGALLKNCSTVDSTGTQLTALL